MPDHLAFMPSPIATIGQSIKTVAFAPKCKLGLEHAAPKVSIKFMGFEQMPNWAKYGNVTVFLIVSDYCAGHLSLHPGV